VLRKAAQSSVFPDNSILRDVIPGSKEIEIIKLFRKFPETVSAAAKGYSPALIANYCYDLSKEYNQFYHDFTILGESDEALRNFRLVLSAVTSEILSTGMFLLGIEMPERM
jgi:arginyl-tRNA synthetase